MDVHEEYIAMQHRIGNYMYMHVHVHENVCITCVNNAKTKKNKKKTKMFPGCTEFNIHVHALNNRWYN